MKSPNRRCFIKAVGIGTVALTIPGCSRPYNERKLLNDRRIAKQRKRRIIMNNDGNDFAPPWPDDQAKAAEFLQKRTIPLAGSHVDSIFYCTGELK